LLAENSLTQELQQSFGKDAMQKKHKWSQLRCEQMSPESSFEELCSQISRCSPPTGSVEFIRNGTPDGGIEFYWTLKSKQVVGWQCKFFQGPLTPGQWAQLDKSFKDALDHYPELTDYVVAMPQDLAQGRDKNKKSFRERWTDHVGSWTALAQKRKRKIKIQYFGDAEIFNFLDTEDQSGRRWYWFEQVALTQQWSERRLKAAIANAGARYTPELNIEVPLRKTIEFLGRTENFRTIILTLRGKIRKASRHVLRDSSTKFITKTKFNKLTGMARNLDEALSAASELELQNIDWQNIRENCGEITSLLREIATAIRIKKEKMPPPRSTAPNQSDLMVMILHEIDQWIFSIHALLSEIDGVAAEVSELKALLITGEAGSGKTHLLCDVATQRVKKGLPTVLLYGEHFQDEEPWSQICKQLQLVDIGCDEFLQALESAGQAKRERSLIIIDGLNEGVGKTLWKKYLPGMLATLSTYKWIGLAISLRSGFEPYLVESGNIEDLQLIIRNHRGFADVEFNAIPHFCKHYKLDMPSVPVLLPEFQNPLFLKLTCEALKASDCRHLPLGTPGIKSTFDTFVSAIDAKLAKKLGLDLKEKLVQTSLESLSQSMAQHHTSMLPYADAKAIVNKLSSADRFEDSLFRHLISEGVLAETVRYNKDGKPEDHIRFAYERFSDHLIASHLLLRVSTLANLKKQFASEGPLGKLCIAPYANRGILEALSIQVPEKFGRELHSLIPATAEEFSFALILLSGLIWREPKTIDQDCIKFLLKWACANRRFRNLFLDIVIALSPIPSHPLNADFLDQILSEQTMAARDSFWTAFISGYSAFGRETAVARMIYWMNEHDSSSLSDQSARLFAIVLTWMLASPNRILRDRSTKALVRLLQNRIQLLTDILKHFADVDDLYIVERVFGIAYGCTLRAANVTDFKDIANFVFEKEFRSGRPRKNILLRDHARGIIEICAASSIVPDAWRQKATPPYNTLTLPKFPTQQSIDKYKTGNFNQGITTLSNLYYSIMGDDDFTRDVLGANLSGRWLTKSSRRARAKQKDAHSWNRLGQIDWRGPQRWILQRVLDLGWTEERFGSFDHAQHQRGSLSRYDRKFEGFEKKYTWLALYEVLAYLQDSADFNDADFDGPDTAYVGPWQLSYIRNIDFSRLEALENPPTYVASFPKQPPYDSWTRPASQTEWIKRRTDLPDPLLLLGANDWLSLRGTFDWEEPTGPGEDKYDNPRRSFWIEIHSCLVRSTDAHVVHSWLLKQDLFKEPLPKPPHSYDIFLGDFFRGLAYQYQNRPYYCREGWTRDYNDKIPAEILITTDGYFNESGVYDNSFENPVNFSLPCNWLVKEMKLQWNGDAGFVDPARSVVAVDPTYWNLGKSQLLFNRAKLTKFMKASGLELIWLVRGRKCILGEKWGRGVPAGRLELQAVYRLKAGKIIGTSNYVLTDQNRKRANLKAPHS
jgi:hypothetical protein